MQQLSLTPISKIEIKETADFIHTYFNNNQPVIITNYCSHWPAMGKWTFDYFKKSVGHIKVPLYAEAFADTGKSYMEPTTKMLFGDYLDLIANDATTLRMFLFNIFKYMPNLCADFDYPLLTKGYLKKYPFMFFGGKNSFVDVHYDIDLSHVFLTQFLGERKIILFPPEDSVSLYRHPFTVSTNVDLGNVDYTRYPKIVQTNGLICTLKPFETLFIPSGYWHYIYYEQGGFGLSLRAWPTCPMRRLQGLWNIAKLSLIDNNLSKILGPKRWYDWKEAWAIYRAKN
jgi:nitrite reductase/ring-hydroxylating ferredoxin subunit